MRWFIQKYVYRDLPNKRVKYDKGMRFRTKHHVPTVLCNEEYMFPASNGGTGSGIHFTTYNSPSIFYKFSLLGNKMKVKKNV